MTADQRSRRDDGRVLVQVRLPKDLVKRLDHLRIDRGVARAALIEQFLTEALAHAGRGATGD